MGHEIDDLMRRVRAGEVRALARAVSLVEAGGEQAGAVLAACRASVQKALRIGVTGPPGAGKSTLVDQMARLLRQENKTVGIVAFDPSSPFTGGALLGDRIRMQGFVGDAGVFIRSMASRGALGGVALAAEGVCAVMEAAGREVLLIETVGVGQDGVEITGLVDVTVVVMVPGMGDDVQSLKAGLMETANIFVINKSDREGAERLEAELRGMQSLGQRPGTSVPEIVRTVATSGEGVDEVMKAVERWLAVRGAAAVRGVTGHDVLARETGYRPGMKLDHLGIAVRSLSAARVFYESLGMVVTHEEVVEHEQVRTAMLPLGETRIELLEATCEDSTIGRFVRKRGEGLHHVALRVEGVDAMFGRLKEAGVRLASDAVRVGAGGHRYFFVHPASTGGVLLEMVGE